MTPKYEPDPSPIIRLVGKVYVVLAFLSGVPLLAWIFGAKFLPSMEWVADAQPVATVWALAFAAGGVFFIRRAQSLRTPASDRGSFMDNATLLFAPLLCFSLGKDAILVGGPMLFAVVAGGPTELEYIIERAEGFSDRKCRNKIELRDMPFQFDKLCRFSKAFRDSLHPGQRIIVSGTGTPLGIFVAEAQAVGP